MSFYCEMPTDTVYGAERTRKRSLHLLLKLHHLSSIIARKLLTYWFTLTHGILHGWQDFLKFVSKIIWFFCLLCHLWTQVLCFRFASFLLMTSRGTNNLTKAKGHTDLYIDDKNTGVLVTNTYESNEGGTDNHERGKGTKTCQTSRRHLRRKQPSHWNRKQTKDN